MPLSERFQRQVALLIEALPFVAEEKDFALKGGTAISRFVRDMPRLSVDIDLTYLPVSPRPESLAAIDAAMNQRASLRRRKTRWLAYSMAKKRAGSWSRGSTFLCGNLFAVDGTGFGSITRRGLFAWQ